MEHLIVIMFTETREIWKMFNVKSKFLWYFTRNCFDALHSFGI